ncbi:GPI ethanolamine phosphate transferase 2-like isoform X1 [Papaver somniferum]|uniref:GPI ethanolamine phosphate transferase 2-like isoform X1 n=4 Tax=Papaver somniferum TaxID=3469 RepID=UPI000E6FE7EE|nr:GPI ethanolamine phosphate transferase 2-like isoform X1 [Papaver somniferum]
MSSSSSLTCGRLATWTIIAVLLQILGLLLFVLGFFPVKPALSGVSGMESYRDPMSSSREDQEQIKHLSQNQLRSLYKDMSKISPTFDRLILMVVDGLPAEFVLGRGDQPPTKAMMEAMPYTQSLLSHGKAIGYHAKAAPPTVTMPRLKAMVSGAIGGFLDVAFNFNSQAFRDDNLLGQLYSIGWKMVMLGDETWIKLFPGLFTRHDGVSSFYVKDTVEVDHNVSRHLGAELTATDWDLLILHYLGLDHVGHIGGRSSTLMIPKLKEMDEVIKKIHMSSDLPQDSSNGRTLLMVVSDHGMTENGNHGGSSYEETDSLALFIGIGSKLPDYALATRKTASQVDIAPTLALLFGVPIPKNNIGVLMSEAFDSLADDQKLRALKLNSWQLLRLLQAQLPALSCSSYPCDNYDGAQCSGINACKVSIEQKFCCLFSKATTLHSSWTSQKHRTSRSNNSEDARSIFAAYNEFLRTSSEWLSRRATDKPPELLAPGIASMAVSCAMFLFILFCLCKEVYLKENQGLLDCSYKWHLDEVYALVVVVIFVFSMGSSSMVEEEQYIWHFLTSTLYLIFLRKSFQLPSPGAVPNMGNVIKRLKSSNHCPIYSIIFVLICGRILRGWHQGGVNWVHLPDISKWLEQTDPPTIQSFQIVSLLFIIGMSSFNLYLLEPKRRIVLVIQVSLFLSGFLLVMHIMEFQGTVFGQSNYSSTLIAQSIYATIIMTVIVTVLQAPWVTPVSVRDHQVNNESLLVNSASKDMEIRSLLPAVKYSLHLIGLTYTVCWCLLQLLLQQPVNAMPVLLLFFQILGSMFYFSNNETHSKHWVEVAALYFLGMAGHFGLGNSNTLATIDVAGAFIGISSHSTLLSGVLMFIITMASPMLFLLSLVFYISTKDASYLLLSKNGDLGHLLQMMIGFPCLVPLALNSVMLTAFTVVLFAMRNHLFVWSVFSPKYLYVLAMAVCVYVGVFIVAVAGIYTCSVFFLRERMLRPKSITKLKS